MVTTPDGIDPDATTPQEDAARIARSLIAGHPEGAVRRIVLYWLALVSLVVAIFLPPVLVVTASALVLLALTDQLA